MEMGNAMTSDDISWVFKIQVKSLDRICKIELTQGFHHKKESGKFNSRNT